VDHDLKNEKVLPYAQKLLGISSKGKIPSDEVISRMMIKSVHRFMETPLAQLNLKNPTKIMLMGSTEKETEQVRKSEEEAKQTLELQRIQM
jgi:hypothetical protein